MFKKLILFIVFILIFAFICVYYFNNEESLFLREDLNYNVIFVSNEEALKNVKIGDPENIFVLNKDKEKLLPFIESNFLNYNLIEKEELFFPEENDLFLCSFELTNYDFQNIKIKKDIKNLFNKGTEEINDNILFKNKEGVYDNTKTFLFVGDMMFDRGVESLSTIKNNFNYPFEKIRDFFKNIDYVIGNLEGPIMENPVYISDSSITFSFNKEIANVLKNNNFNLLSLANNHTMNNGGLEETKLFLEDVQINYAGDPYTCLKDDIFVNEDFIFYAVNTTYPFNCSEKEIIENISDDKFLIVMIHWGEEYEYIPSKYQINLAHQMIDAGADLIIGSHPHVVQSIEKYKDKLIFYSLGNFIFDQYFSKETQQGLLVVLEKYEDKLIYNLYLSESELAQPEIKKNNDFFLWLSNISSDEIREEIIEQEITIYSKD